MLTVLGWFNAGDEMLPMHLYILSCEVLKGLKVSIVTASLSLGASVAIVMFPPVIIGSPLALSHIAVGMLVRPEMVSLMTQVRVNSDPATLLPELLTVAEMGSEGTAGNMVVR